MAKGFCVCPTFPRTSLNTTALLSARLASSAFQITPHGCGYRIAPQNADITWANASNLLPYIVRRSWMGKAVPRVARPWSPEGQSARVESQGASRKGHSLPHGWAQASPQALRSASGTRARAMINELARTPWVEDGRVDSRPERDAQECSLPLLRGWRPAAPHPPRARGDGAEMSPGCIIRE